MTKQNQIISLMGEDGPKESAEARSDGARVHPPAVRPGPALPDGGPQGPGPKPGAPPLEERVLAPGEAPPPPRMIEGQAAPLPPIAPAAGLKARHWRLMFAFFAFVLGPVLLVAAYLFTVAEDQYASTTGFTVQREEGGGASDLLGGLVSFGGVAGGASDTDVLFEFIQSQEMVERIDAKLDLRGHYAQHWEGPIWASDKVFSIWPDAAIEDLVWYWSRMVRISYDQATGLMELQVLAFDPDYAQALAQEIVAESQSVINTLSDASRADATRYAEDDLAEALERLKIAREALTAFRTRTQIVDPLADLQGRLGVMSNLQQQLAQSLIDFDLLRDTTSPGDPRLVQAQRRIEAIRERIASERATFANDDTTSGAVGEAYPVLIAEFERLSVDREYAEETYRAALTALDAARTSAARQSRYLATYIEPTKAQRPDFPKRFTLTFLAAVFVLLTWSIAILIYYSVRDRR